jgi:hypothetical protein
MWFGPNVQRFFFFATATILIGSFACSQGDANSSKSAAKRINVAPPEQEQLKVNLVLKTDKEAEQSVSQASSPNLLAGDLLIDGPQVGFGGVVDVGFPGGFVGGFDVPLTPFIGPDIPPPWLVPPPLRVITFGNRDDDDGRNRRRDDDHHRRDDDTGRNDDDCARADDNNCPVDDDGAPI